MFVMDYFLCVSQDTKIVSHALLWKLIFPWVSGKVYYINLGLPV